MNGKDPGLDLTALRGLRAGRDSAPILTRIEAHLDENEGYLPFSGGKDSLTVLHLARQVDPEIPVVFFDSGLEYPETYTYLDQLAQAWSLNLQTIPATKPTLQVLIESGHWDHQAPTNAADLFASLIAEPAAQAHAEHGPGELWGVRAAESNGRAAAYVTALRAVDCSCCTDTRSRRATHGGLISRFDGTVAYGPIWDWSDEEVWGYIGRHELPANPVYAKLRRLGAPEHFWRVSHMLDGSRLEHGRVTWLRRGWPDLFHELATVLPRLREYV